MPASESSSEPKLEQLSALHCECITRAKFVSDQSGVLISDEIASLVTENAFRFAQLLATDLEAFARHAKRSTINRDDVILFTRRNPLLRKFLDEKSATFDVASGEEDEGTKLQLLKRRARRSRTAKKSHDNSSMMSPLKTYFSPTDNTPSTSNVSRAAVSPLKRAFLESALSLTVSTPVEADRQQPGTGTPKISLLDSDDEFSSIFDDIGDV
ncbi:unnamed protein product [Hydatigera taeniaeformis]|uniref:Centromere protein S n=1 Tax=Hydatigena taeniaeformis TaxID=6205 RepID=A0A0R3X3T0_HYDTA|nr:unnamed protein product [Hydatigera taeniaeformis]